MSQYSAHIVFKGSQFTGGKTQGVVVDKKAIISARIYFCDGGYESQGAV